VLNEIPEDAIGMSTSRETFKASVVKNVPVELF